MITNAPAQNETAPAPALDQAAKIAALEQQVAASTDTIETLDCRIASLEQQNTELRTKLTITHAELIKAERQQHAKKTPAPPQPSTY